MDEQSQSDQKLPFATKLHRMVSSFPYLQAVGNEIRCRICKKMLQTLNTSNWKKHLRSLEHIKNKQVQIPHRVFRDDIMFIFGVCNIRLNVLNNEHFRRFWKRYIPKWELPTMNRINYHVPRIKNQIQQNVRLELENCKIWITVDEITDRRNHKVGHVLGRILTPNEVVKPYLLASKRLAKTNAITIQQLVMETVEKFRIDKNNVLMLVTNGTDYMIEAGTLLKNVYPNVLHITCVVDALHCVAETIRTSYPDVDDLITSTKKIFFKSPQRIEEFHESCPGIPLPPQPILTRWGTWLKAAFYYDINFRAVGSVLSKFDPTESKAIGESQRLLANSQVETDLHTIQANYSTLYEAIDKLQETSLSLSESLEIVQNVQKALQMLTDELGIRAAMKVNEVLKKNPDFVQLCSINQCIRDGHHTNVLQPYFAYANITSVEVQRSFSQYKALYTDKRTRLKETTLEAFLMMQIFSQTHPLLTTQ